MDNSAFNSIPNGNEIGKINRIFALKILTEQREANTFGVFSQGAFESQWSLVEQELNKLTLKEIDELIKEKELTEDVSSILKRLNNLNQGFGTRANWWNFS